MQLEITILNWEKHNSKDFNARYPKWFRMNNDIWGSESLFELTAEQKWIWVCLLARASQLGTGKYQINIKWLSDISKVKIATIEDCLQKLVLANSLAIDTQLKGNQLVPTDRQTNKQTIEQFDIDFLYEIYPRKIGKKKGLAICKRVIKNETDYDRVRLAIGNYAAWIREEKKEAQFIKHFSTFMNSWEDWIDFTRKAEIKPIFNFDEDSSV